MKILRYRGVPASGQVPKWDGQKWTPQTPSAGGGGVDSVVAGDGIAVDSSDAANPVVSATSGASGLPASFVGAGGTETIAVDPAAFGAVAFGAVAATAGRTAAITVDSYGIGAFAHGFAASNGGVNASISAGNVGGGFAGGYARGGAITASGGGSFAFGYATSFSPNAQSTIQASGFGGSFALGYAEKGGTLRATAAGSFALGYAEGTGVINASGEGSLAFGYALAGQTISATASGAVQFGPGVNALANSVQIGAGIQILGTVGANGAPANGQIWREGAVVKIRSNGVTVSL